MNVVLTFVGRSVYVTVVWNSDYIYFCTGFQY